MLAILSKMLRLLSPIAWKRYEARYHALNRLVKIFDFRMYELYVTWFRDPEFLRICSGSRFYDGCPENIGAKYFVLFQFVKAVNGVEGDTAECGIGKGTSSYLILKANQNSGKIHHAFDSFEGLSDPKPEDEVSIDRIFKWRQHNLSTPESKVRDNLEAFENVKFYKGWIPERFNEVIDRKFCFVHIDVDLYQPTIDSLAFFYPRISPGGIIVCDDYGFESCPGVKSACDEFLEDQKEKIIHLSSGQGIIIKNCSP